MSNKNTSIASVYLKQLLVWFGLVVLSGLATVLAGMDLGKFIPVIVLAIAAGQTYLVARIFIQIHAVDKPSKIFVGLSTAFLVVSFILILI